MHSLSAAMAVSTRMGMSDDTPMLPRDALRRIRERQGLTRAALAERVDTAERVIAALERGEQRLSDVWIAKLAPAMNAASADLLAEAPFAHQVVVLGRAQAGSWSEAWEWPDDLRYTVAVPLTERQARARVYGVEVVGDSMDRIYPEGSVCVVASLNRLGETAQSGRRYLIERKRGGAIETTIKRLQVRDDVWWLVPESDNPIHQAFPMNDPDADEVRIRGRIIRSIRAE